MSYTQYNDIKHSDTQHNIKKHDIHYNNTQQNGMLSAIMLSDDYAKCRE
jgi:hypothetical protein